MSYRLRFVEPKAAVGQITQKKDYKQFWLSLCEVSEELIQGLLQALQEDLANLSLKLTISLHALMSAK